VVDNLTQHAYQYIHGKLAGGSLAPGAHLSNRMFAKEMGTSLTPIRGAFNRLVSEGLLEYRPGVGVFVPMPNRREIEELFELREILECAASGKVCGSPSARAFEEMKCTLTELEEIIKLCEQAGCSLRREKHLKLICQNDIHFHLALLRAAGNRRVVETVKDLLIRTQIICHQVSEEMFNNLPWMANEHRDIRETLHRNDTEEVRRLLADHIRRECKLALEAHDQHYMDTTRSFA